MFHPFAWPESFESLPARIRRFATETPAKPALIGDDGTTVTWADFNAAMERMAASLAALGVVKGDTIGLCANLTPAAVIAFMAGLRAGACLALMPRHAAPEVTAKMLGDSAARLLLADHANAEEFAALALPKFGLDHQAFGFRALPDAGNQAPPVALDRTDRFNLIYSSGTTGTPKGIQHLHGTREAVFKRWQAAGVNQDAVTICATGIESNTTLVALLSAIAFGGTCVLMAKFDAGRYLELAARHRATATMLVPVQYRRILDHPAFENADLSTFTLKWSTSAPLDAAVKRRIVERWPGLFIEVYGTTEGGGSCSLSATEYPDKLHTVGRPSEGADMRIVDDLGNELPHGQIGEVVGRGATMMTGYHGRPDLTDALLWRSPEGHVYFRSGDLGRFDADGFLELLDRKKDVIISGGANIYAVDLETVLHQHPDVAESTVIGIPSAEWGETPLALVVARPGRDIDPETLKRWANERLGKNQRLSGVELRSGLPRSDIGKVLKRELRAAYWPNRPV